MSKFLKIEDIHPGQNWCDSSYRIYVTVTKVENGWVEYQWEENGNIVTHEKDVFSFQCRYSILGEPVLFTHLYHRICYDPNFSRK